MLTLRRNVLALALLTSVGFGMATGCTDTNDSGRIPSDGGTAGTGDGGGASDGAAGTGGGTERAGFA